jgi:threonine dehydratase
MLGPLNVTEFNYRYSDPKEAHVFVGIQIPNRDESQRLLERFRTSGYAALDLTDNELAKLHIRHLVGGRAPQVQHEQLYRFEFPERPGALMRFLDRMHENWNISLFHYRNHGADYGRVLIGMQVPPDERDAFQAFLSRIGYPWVHEAANPAAKLFLA